MIHIFYHKADLDGHCSGAICKYALPDAVLHGIDYGEPFPWKGIGKEDEVVMIDFSLQPFSDMVRLRDACRRFIWIDHHKSAIEEYGVIPEQWAAVLRGDYAACELAWMYFFPTIPTSAAVHWLGRYDIWKHADVPGALEFQYGMRLQNTDPENQAFWIDLFHSETYAEHIRKEGELLLRYERMQNERFAKAFAFETELDGLRCIALNRGFTNSLIFDSVYDPERHDAMLLFSWRGGMWHISLYSTKEDVDVSEVCKRHGGGGHKGAAGFQCNELPFALFPAPPPLKDPFAED